MAARIFVICPLCWHNGVEKEYETKQKLTVSSFNIISCHLYHCIISHILCLKFTYAIIIINVALPRRQAILGTARNQY